MPKIIEGLREQLLAEAKRQILEQGYAKTTVRSVASALGVGVGTVYNYFESKEMLVATFVFEQWREYLAHIESLPTDDPRALLSGIFEAIKRFAGANERLFSDADAAKLISAGSAERHKMLREQIAGFILPIAPDRFSAEFISEALIRWAMEDVDFGLIYPLIEKAIK